jgi:hypothetical protein
VETLSGGEEGEGPRRGETGRMPPPCPLRLERKESPRYLRTA